MEEFTVHVGWTSTRPVRPDEHWSSVTVLADSAMHAELVAHHMVAGRSVCKMVTNLITVV